MYTPTISVIVPVFNVEQYLNECIDSILKQSFQDFELILIDDGSTDQSGKICDAYVKKDPRVIVLHRANGGLSAARNTGIEIASGNYLFFVDSDDLIAPDSLERMMRVMSRENTSIVMCRKNSFPEFREPELIPGKDYPDIVHVMTGRDLCIQRFDPEKKILITAWGKLFLRPLWADHLFPVGKIHEDQFVIPIIMYQAEQVAVMEAELYYYRLRKGSITSNFTKKHFDNIEGMDVVLQFYQEQRDQQLVKYLKKHRAKTLAQYIVLAKQNGINELPANCQMRMIKALKIIRQYYDDEKFCELLSSVYPRIGRLYRHLCSIKRMIQSWI